MNCSDDRLCKTTNNRLSLHTEEEVSVDTPQRPSFSRDVAQNSQLETSVAHTPVVDAVDLSGMYQFSLI